jgi:membrane protease YdiL (CAAX protease family)
MNREIEREDSPKTDLSAEDPSAEESTVDEEPVDEEPIRDPCETRPPAHGQGGGEQLPPAGLVRAGLLFYGGLAVVAVIWRMAIYQEDIFYGGAGQAELRWLRDVSLGLGVAFVAILASNIVTERTPWGRRMAGGLAEALGSLSPHDAVLLAFASGLAEELFFRGALQPRVGLVTASLLFGALHIVPRREFLPYTLFAVGMGFALGTLFDYTGNLVAPVVAHIGINAVNMPLLIRRYGSG